MAFDPGEAKFAKTEFVRQSQLGLGQAQNKRRGITGVHISTTVLIPAHRMEQTWTPRHGGASALRPHASHCDSECSRRSQQVQVICGGDYDIPLRYP